MQRSWQRLCAAYGVAGALLVLLHARIGPGVAAEVAYTAVTALALLAVTAGVRHHRPRVLGPWRLAGIGLAFAVVASVGWVVFLLLGLDTAPLGLLYLLAWVFCVVAAWSLTSLRNHGGGLGAALDVAIVTTGSGILLYVFVVQPTWDGATGSGLGRAIAVIYPLFGLALVAVLSRLLFGGAARVPAFWHLGTAVLMLLAADVMHAVGMMHGSEPSNGPGSLRLLGFVFLGATALHPTMTRLTDEVDADQFRLSRPRLLALWGASVAAPVTLLLRSGFSRGPELPVVALGSVALFTLVVARMWGLLGSHARLLRQEHESRFRALVEHAEDVIALVDENDLITYVSTSVRTAFGYEPEVVLGQGGLPLDAATGGRLRSALDELRTADGVRPVRLHGRVMHADGGWREAEAVLVDRRRDPAIGRIVVTVRDVTAQRELEQQLTHQAFHDALTGLPNRALFVDRARQALDVRRADASMCAVLFLDLDDFKTVNDSLGHDQGDALLKTVGERLAAVVRGEDTVARLGGDEFAILVPRALEPRIVIALAERVLAAVSEPLVLAG
ncbi:MAG: diguanylate cyclase, partial [Actinobacteria bacterium]|nr:diguanylate cyclase [Actinomycetota bacterium]